MTEVTAGWARTKAVARWVSGIPGLGREVGELLDRLQLGPVARHGEVEVPGPHPLGPVAAWWDRPVPTASHCSGARRSGRPCRSRWAAGSTAASMVRSRRSSTAAARCGTGDGHAGLPPTAPRRSARRGRWRNRWPVPCPSAPGRRVRRASRPGPCRSPAGAAGRGRCGRCRAAGGCRSMACAIQRGDPPRRLRSGPLGRPNLVASTTSSRRPFRALPTISSDSPSE